VVSGHLIIDIASSRKRELILGRTLRVAGDGRLPDSDPARPRRKGGSMNAKLYLTISAVLSVLYAAAFILLPGPTVVLFGGPAEPHNMLNVQFFGAALLALAVTDWLAKDFRDSDAVRGVIIGAVVGDAAVCLVTLWGLIQGSLNALGWSSLMVAGLLLIGALYCLSTGSRGGAGAPL
jgi:hypothetical protein